MKVNVGSWDRYIRILTGVGLLALTVMGPKTAWGWVGLVPFLTAIIGWCPAYAILGVSTCEKKNPNRSCSHCK